MTNAIARLSRLSSLNTIFGLFLLSSDCLPRCFETRNATGRGWTEEVRAASHEAGRGGIPGAAARPPSVGRQEGERRWPGMTGRSAFRGPRANLDVWVSGRAGEPQREREDGIA